MSEGEPMGGAVTGHAQSNVGRTFRAIAMKSELDRLWSEQRAVRYLARLLMAIGSGGAETQKYPWYEIEKRIHDLCKPDNVKGLWGKDAEKIFPSVVPWTGIRRFATRAGYSLSNKNMLNSIAFFISDLSYNPIFARNSQINCRGISSYQEYIDECDVVSAFRHITGIEESLAIPPDEDWKSLLYSNEIDISNAFINSYCISEEGIRKGVEMLFQGKQKAALFECLRYATEPGVIVKSFISVLAPREGCKLSSFLHHYVDRDGFGRSTSGYVLPMENAMLFLGNIERGAGIKVISLDISEKNGFFGGLMLSMNSVRQCLVARTVLRRLPGREVEAFERGECDLSRHAATIREDELLKHLDKELQGHHVTDAQQAAKAVRDALRNDAGFFLPGSVFDENGKSADVRQVLSIVDNALGTQSQTPKLRFRSEDGKFEAYNPLANGGIPINCAVTWGKI